MYGWTKHLFDLDKINNPRPDVWAIDLTERCNLNCPWCCYGDIVNVSPRDIKTSLAISLINEAIDLGMGLKFSGTGEPTLHKDFKKIIEQSLPAIGLGLISNGTNIDKIRFYLDATKNHPNSWVRLSLNDREISNELRLLFEENPGRIGISIVVDDLTKTYPAESLEYLAKLLRKKKPIDFNNHLNINPSECVGRKFEKIFQVDGIVSFCCLSKNMNGSPPTKCPAECKWANVNMDLIWKLNPFT